MSKTTNFTGQPIFGQLLKFMCRDRINSISAKHDADQYDVHPEEIVSIIEDADVEFEYAYQQGIKRIHKSRRILYQDHDRIFELLTNNFDLDATSIAQIYQKCWQIETLFRQLKQNFSI